MAIEEEFSIEIPDKEADAIHSGKKNNSEKAILIAELDADGASVDQAVTYICAQPDAH